MAQKYFITVQDVKDHTDIQQNVDAQQVEPRFSRCQERYIMPVLGEALYNELCQALAAEQQQEPVPMSDNLDALLEQIVPVMAQWVFYKSMPFMVMKASNKGLLSDQNSPSDPQYRTYAKEVKEEAEDRTADLKKWLDKNAADYPNYKTATLSSRPIGGIVF